MGKRIEFIGQIWNHVVSDYVLGFQILMAIILEVDTEKLFEKSLDNPEATSWL